MPDFNTAKVAFKNAVNLFSDNNLNEAIEQLNEILKDLSFVLMAVVPFAPITIPMIAKFAKKHNIDLLPEWFKDSLK